ncbi:MAG TPA: hypothetical protein VGE93_19705, partial [Bryobacteraceae bacterium]
MSGTAALVLSLMWPETTPAVCPNALAADNKVNAMNKRGRQAKFSGGNVFSNESLALLKMFTFDDSSQCWFEIGKIYSQCGSSGQAFPSLTHCSG